MTEDQCQRIYRNAIRMMANDKSMVLHQKYAGKAEFLGGDDVFDEIVVALAVAGRAAARPGAAE